MLLLHETLGHRIVVEARGPDAARPVVLLHGMAGDHRLLVEACDDTLERAGLRRLYLDLPGHGRSTGEPAHADADSLVDALADTLSALVGDTPPLLVAYSYGAYLAQGLLTRASLAGLLLVCPVVEPDFVRRACPAPRVVRHEPPDTPLLFLDEHERDTFLEVATHQIQELLVAYRRAVLPASREADRAFVDAVRARYAFSRLYTDALRACAAPVSIVCGRDDHWVGWEDASRVLVRAFPRAELHVLADCGHLLLLEQPARFRALLDDWLARIPV